MFKKIFNLNKNKNLFKEVRDQGKTYYLSLVMWDELKKKQFTLLKNEEIFKNIGFHPTCEISVFDTRPSEGGVPFLVIYFESYEMGVERFQQCLRLIEQVGSIGIVEFVEMINRNNKFEFGKIFFENLKLN